MREAQGPSCLHLPAPPQGSHPAHLQGEVSLTDIHSGLAVVGVQVQQEVICRGGGVRGAEEW